MSEHTCLFCDHLFTGRRRKFCYDCLPEHSVVGSKTYTHAYNMLNRACGFLEPPPSSKWRPPGSAEIPKRSKRPRSGSCLGCGVQVGGMRSWCSSKCRMRHQRRNARNARADAVEQGSAPALTSHQPTLRVVVKASHHTPRRTILKFVSIVACRVCGSEFERTNKQRITCSDSCQRVLKQDHNRRKNMRRKTVVTGEPYSLHDLFMASGGKCHLCGRKVNINLSGTHPMGPTIDHLLPLSDGGIDCRTNVALAHRSCNVNRSTGGIVQLRLVG